MSRDGLDRILVNEREIAPSSGFVDSVMDSVRHEASAPPPLPFPWKHALPGVVAAILALALLWVSAPALPARHLVFRSGLSVFSPAFSHALQSEKWVGAAWAGLALILSLVVIELSAHFVERGTR